jgi:hypothetical protein
VEKWEARSGFHFSISLKFATNLPALELKSQHELQRPWSLLIQRRQTAQAGGKCIGGLPHDRVVTGGACSGHTAGRVGRSKIGVVSDIESLGAGLKLRPFV